VGKDPNQEYQENHESHRWRESYKPSDETTYEKSQCVAYNLMTAVVGIYAQMPVVEVRNDIMVRPSRKRLAS
jgi:hypothetical protein